MENKKKKYEEEKFYSMGELYKEYINKYKDRNDKRKENGESIVCGEPFPDKDKATKFLKDIASAIGVYEEFTNSAFFQDLFFYIKGFEQFGNREETLERKNEKGNPNYHHYKFTEKEKNGFIKLLDYKDNEEVEKCRGFKEDNLKADPEVRKKIERLFINYLVNYADYFNRPMFYNRFERHLWEFGENIYPVNRIIDNFSNYIDNQRKLIKDLLPEFLEKMIIEYDKGIYWLVQESLELIRDLIFEFTMNFKRSYESIYEMIEKDKENIKDIDKEGREKYLEMIYEVLNSEKFKKEEILLKKLRDGNFRYNKDSHEINKYKEAKLDMIKEFVEIFQKYEKDRKQFPETKKRGMDIHMLFGRTLKMESMSKVFELLEKREECMIEKIRNRIVEEIEGAKEYLQIYNC